MTRKVIGRLKTLMRTKKEKETESIREYGERRVRLRHGVQTREKEYDDTSKNYTTNQ